MTAPYYNRHGVTVLAGDCLDVLATMEPCSVDAVVCDPPYGLEFMGKDWDRFAGAATDRDFKGFVLSQQRTRNVKCPDCGKWAYDHPGRLCECGGIRRAQGSAFQQWCEQWARECLRVLKPGGTLVAFGGTRTYHRLAIGVEDAGFEIRDGMQWIYGSGFPKGKNQLKPAHEPIVLARKPLAGTVAANVLTHGTGGLNIDATRVAHGADVDLSAVQRQSVGEDNGWRRAKNMVGTEVPMYKPEGRWPTNVLLSHGAACADECAPGCPAAELDAQSGTTSSTDRPRQNTAAAHNRTASMGQTTNDWTTTGHSDSGGASRFFPVFRWEAKAPTTERPQVDGIAHPTVKPLALMRWLVRLVAPPGGLVLDPFAGSGTTLHAARAEGFRAIGIEREPTYLPLIKARLDARPRQAAASAVVDDEPVDLLDLLDGEAS